MDTISDFPLNPKAVEFLLPPDIFDELFSENNAPKEDQNQSNGKNVINGIGRDGVSLANNSILYRSTQVVPDYEGVEKNVGHVLPMQQRYTWAQIVKGKPCNNGILKRVFFPSLVESYVKGQKPEGGKEGQSKKTNSSGKEAMHK